MKSLKLLGRDAVLGELLREGFGGEFEAIFQNDVADHEVVESAANGGILTSDDEGFLI
jgi:hypothetical protein